VKPLNRVPLGKMNTELVSTTSNACPAVYRLALQLNRTSYEHRSRCIKELRKAGCTLRIPGTGFSDGNADSLLLGASRIRGHLYGLLRTRLDTEKSLRQGKTPINIPRFNEMPKRIWKAADGPFHVPVNLKYLIYWSCS